MNKDGHEYVGLRRQELAQGDTSPSEPAKESTKQQGHRGLSAQLFLPAKPDLVRRQDEKKLCGICGMEVIPMSCKDEWCRHYHG